MPQKKFFMTKITKSLYALHAHPSSPPLPHHPPTSTPFQPCPCHWRPSGALPPRPMPVDTPPNVLASLPPPAKNAWSQSAPPPTSVINSHSFAVLSSDMESSRGGDGCDMPRGSGVREVGEERSGSEAVELRLRCCVWWGRIGGSGGVCDCCGCCVWRPWSKGDGACGPERAGGGRGEGLVAE